MPNSPWMKWFNSFGFITLVIFFFAFLTTLDFPSGEGMARLPVSYVFAKSEIGQTPDRFRGRATVRHGEAGAPFYMVHGSKAQMYAYKAW